MKFVELDQRIREAFSLAALTLLSGFVGVSIANKPENLAVAGWATSLVLLIAYICRDVSDIGRERGFGQWGWLLFCTVSAWASASILTDKPVLMAGLFVGWIGGSMVSQYGKRGRRMDENFAQMKAALEDAIFENTQAQRRLNAALDAWIEPLSDGDLKKEAKTNE